MKRLLLASALIALVTVACKHQQAAATTAQQTTTANTNTENTTTVSTSDGTNTTTVSSGDPNPVVTNVQADSANLYRVVVSFTSRGEGIDYKTAETFENWVKDQPKHPAYTKTHYGREGETCYCLKLNELSTREQEIFIRDLRTLLTDKPLIFIAEYAPCKGTPE